MMDHRKNRHSGNASIEKEGSFLPSNYGFKPLDSGLEASADSYDKSAQSMVGKITIFVV